MLETDPVLLIEDNDGLREALARLLEARGYRVVQVRDGREGWDFLAHGGCPSVIVLDILMPGMDGRAFRNTQLQHAICANIPVIVFTATREDLPGVVGTVRKADPDSLLDLIARTAGTPVLSE